MTIQVANLYYGTYTMQLPLPWNDMYASSWPYRRRYNIEKIIYR